MPHYFFHFTDGHRQFTDSVGINLTGISAAQLYAAEKIRELQQAMPGVKLQNWLGWKIIAVDSIGNTVYEIGFDSPRLYGTKLRQHITQLARNRVVDAKMRPARSMSAKGH
jgi:uncharacterized protein DUF6894